MTGKDLSIVVPVYNEARNIHPLVSALDESLDDLDWEVIFVDDDSPDGTADTVRDLALQDDRVRLILRIKDRGLSQSCIQGLLSSRADTLCVMDGDGQHDASVIRELLAPLRSGTADIVSAARCFDGSSTAALSPFRTGLSRVGNRVCGALLGRDVNDPLTGFFALSRATLLKVVRKIDAPGFKILLAILAADPSLRHAEVPFSFRKRLHGESKLDSVVIWQFFAYSLSQLTRGLVPARAMSFVLVGLSGLFVHFAVLYPSLWLGASFTEAQLGAALVAMTSNFLLNNWLTFRDRRLKGFQLLFGYFWFLAISAVGLVANVAVATLAFERLRGMTALSALAGIAVDTVWKFVVSNRLVWRDRSTTP
jgi:dolichol-phosphate mannosyltransferase